MLTLVLAPQPVPGQAQWTYGLPVLQAWGWVKGSPVRQPALPLMLGQARLACNLPDSKGSPMHRIALQAWENWKGSPVQLICSSH